MYTGVMADATIELRHIHDRLPVILHADSHASWLDLSAAVGLNLLKKYAASELSVETTADSWFRKPQSGQ